MASISNNLDGYFLKVLEFNEFIDDLSDFLTDKTKSVADLCQAYTRKEAEFSTLKCEDATAAPHLIRLLKKMKRLASRLQEKCPVFTAKVLGAKDTVYPAVDANGHAEVSKKETIYPDFPEVLIKERIETISKTQGYLMIHGMNQPITSFLALEHPCKFEFGGSDYMSADLCAREVINKDNVEDHLRILTHIQLAKFGQNEQLKELLLATGNAYLKTQGDRDNLLGQALMSARKQYGGTGIVDNPIKS